MALSAVLKKWVYSDISDTLKRERLPILHALKRKNPSISNTLKRVLPPFLPP